VGFDGRWYNDSGVGSYIAGLLPALAHLQNLELVVYEDPANPVPTLTGASIRRVPLSARKYSAAEQLQLARRCELDRLDLLHGPFYVIPFAAGCPVVVTIHDLIPFLYPIYSWGKTAIVRQAYRMTTRKAAHVIADSEATAHEIRQTLGVDAERISVVHLAAAECYRSTSDPEEERILKERFGIRAPYVVAASAANWKTKNLESALQSVEIAGQRCGVQFQTVVYGPPHGIKAAGGEERWASLNLICTGYVIDADLARIFRHATAFILSSLYEGFGLPVLEAMSCGCPVVTSNGGALAEVAGSGAQAFDPADVNGMAAALRSLLADPEKLVQWRAAALTRARDFSWQKTACETMSVYHRTLNGALPQSGI
jgi:glycosyltransferase involved in cell wall biosynthesis